MTTIEISRYFAAALAVLVIVVDITFFVTELIMMIKKILSKRKENENNV